MANSFLASSNFYHLLMTFANSLDKLFDTLIVLLEEFFEKVNFERSQQTTTKHGKLTSIQRDKSRFISFPVVTGQALTPYLHINTK